MGKFDNIFSFSLLNRTKKQITLGFNFLRIFVSIFVSKMPVAWFTLRLLYFKLLEHFTMLQNMFAVITYVEPPDYFLYSREQ